MFTRPTALTAKFLLFALAVVCIPVHAADGTEAFPTRAQRIARGQAYLAYLRQLSDLMSAPRPSERDWVEKERAALGRLPDDTNSRGRQARLLRSIEFQHVRLYDHLAETQTALQCAIASTSSTPTEMYCWAKASTLLSYGDIFQSGVTTLLAAKRLPPNLAKTLNRTSNAGVIIWFEFYSHSIANDYVIPYLADQARLSGRK